MSFQHIQVIDKKTIPFIDYVISPTTVHLLNFKHIKQCVILGNIHSHLNEITGSCQGGAGS